MEIMESNLAQLLEVTSGIEVAFKIGKGLEQRLTGRFYTHERIGRAMAKDIAKRVKNIDGQIIKIIDPFCGDGRLIRWLIEELYAAGKLPTAGLSVVMWDCDKEAIKVAQDAVQILFSKIPTSNNKIEIREIDSFSETLFVEGTFDICVTNPPWETIKPDKPLLLS